MSRGRLHGFRSNWNVTANYWLSAGASRDIADTRIFRPQSLIVGQFAGSIGGEGFELTEAFGARQVPLLGRVTRPQHLFYSCEIGRRPLQNCQVFGYQPDPVTS